MARNETLNSPAGQWLQLTNANASAVCVQNQTNSAISLQATNGATAPTSTGGAKLLSPLQTLAADLTISQLWPGVSGANRLWAYSDLGGPVSVSHADA